VKRSAGPPAAGVRPRWHEAPAAIRSAVDGVCGSPIVHADNQTGGFSPGVAARVLCADGRRYFVKAVSAAANPQTPGLHRREAVVLTGLAPLIRRRAVPAPALIGIVEEEEWVALVLEDISGGQPVLPWRAADLILVLTAIEQLTVALTPAPMDAPPAAQAYAKAFSGWRSLAQADAGTLTRLDEWSRARVDELADIEATWVVHAEGDTLLHTDLRADNMLLSARGVVVVDWPWACIGNPLLDVVGFAPSVAMQGGPDPSALLRMTAVGRAADPAAVRALACALAGYFTAVALEPDPQGLPTVRAFQAAQGFVARRWLTELIDDPQLTSRR